MRTKINNQNASAWLTAVCLVFAVLGYLHFIGFGSKWMTLLAGIAIIALLVFGELKKLCNLPSLFLLGYVLFSWLTAFWAMSGKFHLREWSKIFTALTVFLFITICGKADKAFVRRVMGVIAGISAFYAFASVEAAATGVCKALVQKLPGTGVIVMEFNRGARLFGVFGNSNVEASIYAIGVLFSLALLCGAENRRQRGAFAVTLSLNAFAFLLVFSMGAIVCFAAAVIVYLIAAGAQRSAVLTRMLLAAIPTALFALFAARFFDRGGLAFVALVLMLANAAVVAGLELTVGEKLSALLQSRQKVTFLLLAAIAALAVLFVTVGTRVTGPYAFGSELNRSISLDAGEHTMRLDTNAPVVVEINSQSRVEIMSIQYNGLFAGECDGEVTFTVPEGAEICSFRFTAPNGTTLRSAVLDGKTELPLKYKLLPDFIGNRVQNLTNSTSVIQRRIFAQDGLKLFRLSPIVGNGMGAYETGITAVQDFHYETKYVHNHYIQVLLEDGMIGFALFAAALVSMAVALWKGRKVMRDGPLCAIYAALCAEFVMSSAQMLWDVSMSFVVFTCMAYVNYGLIVLICAEPLKKEAETAAEVPTKKKKKAAATVKEMPLPQIAGAVIAGLIVLTLCGNLYAQRLGDTPVASAEGFFRNMERAARLDLYEHNDSKLSYVVNAAQAESGRYIAQANVYAEELGRVQSNTIPRYLVAYYLQTAQYEAAIDEAMLGATYSATVDETWNQCAGLLKQVFFDSGEASPLLTERETLMPRLIAYYDALQSHNAAAVLPVVPDENAQQFFDKVAALSVCADDETKFAEVLLAQ